MCALNPTFHTTTSATLLDLILTNNIQKIRHHGQLSIPGISRHDMILASYALRFESKRMSKLITYRDFSKINDAALRADV